MLSLKTLTCNGDIVPHSIVHILVACRNSTVSMDFCIDKCSI